VSRRGLVAALTLLVALPLAATSGARASGGTRAPMVVAASTAPRAAAPTRAAAAARGRAPRAGEIGTRPSGADEPDATGGRQTHLVYFVPKDRPDESLDSTTLPRSVDAMRAWFSREFARSGDASTPRFDRLVGGGWDITFVRGDEAAAWYGSMPGANALADVRAELQRKNFSSPAKRYLIFGALDAGTTCGEGDYPLQPEEDTGHYAIVYLDSADACGARAFATSGSASGGGKAETIAAHEWLHTEGVAPLAAPHHCATSPYHICTGPLWLAPDLDPESREIVFPVITGALGGEELDRDRDDYLDSPVPGARNLRSSPWLE
jgi:hypothetical protein